MLMSDAPSDVDEPVVADTDAAEIDAEADLPESALDSDRYAHLSLDDGAVVIYDREEPDTWLQSDFVVEVGV